MGLPALQKSLPIDPQQLAQSSGIASVGLAQLPVFRLDENHLVAAIIVQHLNQPVVEATNLKHRDKRVVRTHPVTSELLEKRLDLLRLCGHLTGQHIAVVVAERDRNLSCVLIDPQIQYRWFSSWSVGWKVRCFTLPTREENRLYSIRPLFHRYQRRLAELPWVLRCVDLSAQGRLLDQRANLPGSGRNRRLCTGVPIQPIPDRDRLMELLDSIAANGPAA